MLPLTYQSYVVLECFASTSKKSDVCFAFVRITTNNAENDTVNVLTIHYFEWKWFARRRFANVLTSVNKSEFTEK